MIDVFLQEETQCLASGENTRNVCNKIRITIPTVQFAKVAVTNDHRPNGLNNK